MVPDPDDAQALVEGDLVRVASAEEPTSYLTLEDGTEITHRTSVLEVVRIADRWDSEGKPVYSFTVNGTIKIDVPPNLLRENC